MDRIEEDHAGDPEANLDDLLHTESDHEENMTISSREAMPPRTTNTGQAAPASLPDLALLTSAIVNLNNLLTAKQASTSGETSSSNHWALQYLEKALAAIFEAKNMARISIGPDWSPLQVVTTDPKCDTKLATMSFTPLIWHKIFNIHEMAREQ